MNNQILGNKKKLLFMHELPSVTYEAFYKRNRNGRKRDLFVYPIVGWRRLCQFEWLRAIVEFGGIEYYREGTLEPRRAHLYQLAHSFVLQPHCSSGVHGEGEYPRTRLGGQPVGHYIRIKHDNLQAWR